MPEAYSRRTKATQGTTESRSAPVRTQLCTQRTTRSTLSLQMGHSRLSLRRLSHLRITLHQFRTKAPNHRHSVLQSQCHTFQCPTLSPGSQTTQIHTLCSHPSHNRPNHLTAPCGSSPMPWEDHCYLCHSHQCCAAGPGCLSLSPCCPGQATGNTQGTGQSLQQKSTCSRGRKPECHCNIGRTAVCKQCAGACGICRAQHGAFTCIHVREMQAACRCTGAYASSDQNEGAYPKLNDITASMSK